LRKLLFAFFTLFILVVFSACTPKDNFPYKELLADQEGKYSVIILSPASLLVPDFMVGFEHHLISSIHQSTLRSFKDNYPKIEVDQAPYYIFLDSKGIAFETNKEIDAKDFYEHNIKTETK
jgi:hypothetical protein